jgi:hypothetical protein
MENERSKHGWDDVRSSVGNADIETFEMGKDELNLSEFPIAVVAEAARPGQLTLEFSDTIKDRSTGLPVVRRVTVHGTEEWGLPAAQDDDVMIGLLQLCYLAGWPKRICFTRYQLCKLLRWSVGGASYRRIYQALHRLSTTTYNYRYGWRDKANREWVPSLVFSYIQALKVHETDKPTKSGLCEVTWSDDFHRSLEAGNLKGLDFNRFVSLRSSIAKRLYRFLDKRFGAGHSRYSCDLHVLAFEKIGVSRSYGDAAQIKRLLVPAIRELEGVGFIGAAQISERFERLGRGNWKVHFAPSRGGKEATPAQPSKAPLQEKLIHLGIAPSEAEKFVKKFPGEYLEAKIDQFAYRHVKSNPAGLLAESIRRDLPPPGAYRTPEARAEDSLRKAKAARKQAERKVFLETNRVSDLLAEESRIAKAEAALSGLSREEKNKLESAARKRFPNAGSEVAHWAMIALIRNQLDLDRE